MAHSGLRPQWTLRLWQPLRIEFLARALPRLRIVPQHWEEHPLLKTDRTFRKQTTALRLAFASRYSLNEYFLLSLRSPVSKRTDRSAGTCHQAIALEPERIFN